MDPTDPEQGREKQTPEKCLELTPSSRGRQRKINCRLLDYNTDDLKTNDKSPRRSSEGKEEEEEEEASEKKTPRGRRGRKPKQDGAKKTPAKKRKTDDAGGDELQVQQDVEEKNDAQEENETPKPKRKYVKRQKKKEEEEQVKEKEPEPEEEPEPGGRRRRGAAKAAMKYLQILAKEVFSQPGEEAEPQRKDDKEAETKTNGGKGCRGRKRKREDSDAAEDEDFVPDADEQKEMEMEEDDDDDEDDDEIKESDLDSDDGSYGKSPVIYRSYKSSASPYSKSHNGLNAGAMRTVWEAVDTTKKFREEHHSSWVFPEWVPSTSDWEPVPQSDLERYLPQQRRSASFKVSREGLKKEDAASPQTLRRFQTLPAHPDRWDVCLFSGGPVWAMEWCPTPDGAPASQYLALACHRTMDEQHQNHQTCAKPGLVQLWDFGKLEYNCRPDSQPSLVYCLAVDGGFIWNLKWCPAGGWELPTCVRKAPFLPRLGLLAVATSNGVVTIYSLPHPDALTANKTPPNSGKDDKNPPVYKAQAVVTLKLGGFKAPRHDMSGLVLCMDWLPKKPHNIMAIGFYDGVVGLWDLSTQSALLRVRESNGLMSLLPFQCFLAHDHAVRALAFCPASRFLLVTAGEDRYVKTWDLRKPFDPITCQKRYLTNEVCWPLDAPGLLVAQENGYVPKGSQGVHFMDHNMRSILAIPRLGTVWSLSYTEWINCLVTADSLGEVILSVLPQINTVPPYLKRTLDRRFPIYFTSQVPREATGEEENQDKEGEEDEDDDDDEADEPDAASEGGNENSNEGGRVRKDKYPPLRFQKYKEAVKKFCLHHTDNDLRTFADSEKRPMWKQMKDTEAKTKIKLDDMPMCALHKVRFNPNMSSHVWLACGGQSGLVRLLCLRSLTSPHVKKMIGNNQAQFTSLYESPDQTEAL